MKYKFIVLVNWSLTIDSDSRRSLQQAPGKKGVPWLVGVGNIGTYNHFVIRITCVRIANMQPPGNYMYCVSQVHYVWLDLKHWSGAASSMSRSSHGPTKSTPNYCDIFYKSLQFI